MSNRDYSFLLVCRENRRGCVSVDFREKTKTKKEKKWHGFSCIEPDEMQETASHLIVWQMGLPPAIATDS